MKDYEKKYKEALGWMQSLYNGLHGATKEDAEHYFPELKESEDEKIRKEIINYFECQSRDEPERKSIHNRWIAWLEKQGEQPSAIRWYDVSLIPQEMEELLVEWDSEDATWHEIAFYHADTKTFWNGTRQVENVTRWCYIIDLLEKQGKQKPFDYEHATITQKDFASVGETATIELSSPIDCGDRIYHVSHKPIEKQGEQKVSVADFKAKDWYVSKVDGKIHDMTYNPADKVEPIFSIGDVLCDKSCTTLNKNSQPNIEILDIRDGMYICNNCSFPISQQDEYELVTKKIEPQSAWSEEDENYLQSAENACEYQYGKNTSTILWLKSLKNRIGG